MGFSMPVDQSGQTDSGLSFNKNDQSDPVKTEPHENLPACDAEKTNMDQHAHEAMDQKALIDAICKRLQLKIERGQIPYLSERLEKEDRPPEQTPEAELDQRSYGK